MKEKKTMNILVLTSTDQNRDRNYGNVSMDIKKKEIKTVLLNQHVLDTLVLKLWKATCLSA